VTPKDRVAVLVTVDTEEDNWFPARDGIRTTNIAGLTRLQEVLDRYGLRATLLTTWQVAGSPSAMDTLLMLRDRHRAEIGAHLHPWNTPPITEDFGPGAFGWKHLPPDLQARKLETLTDTLTAATGSRPTSFRAGRWSLGPVGAAALLRSGYRTDSSVLPYLYWFDVPDSPNYYRAPPTPWWVDGTGSVEAPALEGLVEIPPTVGFSRWPWRPWATVDRMLQMGPARMFHAVGILARTRAIEKLALSPEINSSGHMLALARVALAHDIRILNVFLHSGAFTSGCTPYVNSAAQLDRFVRQLDQFFEGLSRLTEFEGVTLGEAGERVRAGDRPAGSTAALPS
jgi:peptidoglycan/xylan/chitin deacetylase (PgdA/CDA1 family)